MYDPTNPQDPDTIRAIISRQAAEDQAAREKAKKGNSDDGELLGTLIVIGCYAAYQGAKFAGKAAIAGGKMAVEGGKIAGKTVINARKLHIRRSRNCKYR